MIAPTTRGETNDRSSSRLGEWSKARVSAKEFYSHDRIVFFFFREKKKLQSEDRATDLSARGREDRGKIDRGEMRERRPISAM